MYNERLQQETMGLTEITYLKTGNTLASGEGLWFCAHVVEQSIVTTWKEKGVGIVEMETTLEPGFHYGPITDVTITSGFIKLYKHVDPIAGSASSVRRK